MSPSGSVGNQAEIEKQDLLNEFRRLTTLRAMVASINSDGRQVVLRSAGGPAILSLERTQPPHRLAMNAVATLLIRRSEVVAVTTPNPNYAFHAEDSAPAKTLEVLALHEAEPDSESNVNAFLEFAAVANPESDNTYDFEDEDHIIVVPDGVARWSQILKDPWHKIAKKK